MDNWNFFAYSLDILPFVVIVLLLSFAVHEFAHAWFADRFGDPGPRAAGRVTLNPRAHIDWLGLILFVIVGVGWAKPVLVNRAMFKSPRRMGIIVTLAGPVSNLLLAFISLIIYVLLVMSGVQNQLGGNGAEAVNVFFTHMVLINIFLFILNLIPLPPLDGYRIVEDLLPLKWLVKVKRYEQWLFFAILLMFFIPFIRERTIGPIFEWQYDIYEVMKKAVFGLFGLN